LSVDPKLIELDFQKTTTKRVRVVPNLVGEVSRDLKLINKRIEPSSVKLIGPFKLMKGVAKVSTLPIDMSTLTKSGILKVNLSEIDQRVEVAEDVSFSFSYEISPRKANVTLKNIPIRFLTSARRYTSKHRSVSMDVLVSEDEQANLKLKSLNVVADIPDGAQGTVDVPLRANLPEGVFLMKIHPETIKVYVRP
jgi:YbbR domain-containing protein